MSRYAIILLVMSLLMPLADKIMGQDAVNADQEAARIRYADSLKAAGYLEKAQRFDLTGNTDSALIYIGLSLEISDERNFTSIEAADFELLAALYEKDGNWEESLRNYLKASAFYTKAGNTDDEARILRILAWSYFRSGIYNKSAWYSEQEFMILGEQYPALKASSAELAGRSYEYLPVDSLSRRWYEAASSWYARSSDTAGMIRCDEKLGVLYSRLGMYQKARDKYQLVLEHYTQLNDFKNAAVINNQLGFLMFRKEDVLSALEYFNRAAGLLEKADNDPYFLTDVWSNIAVCHQNTGNQAEMLRSFEKALDYAEESGRTGEAARINRIIANIYYNKGDNYHAELYCVSCIESAQGSDNQDILQLCYRDYSDILERGNDFVKALAYYEKHLNLRDSLLYAKRLRDQEIADELARYDALEQRIRDEIATEEIRGLEMKTLRAESQRRENEIKLLINAREMERLEKDRLEQSLMLEKERNELRQRDQEVRALQQQQAIDSLLIRQKNDEAFALEQANRLLETDKLQKETELKNERLARQLAVGLGSLALIVALLILLSLLSVRKKNRLLATQKRQIEKINTDLETKNIEILQQKEIIEQKNQSITDSIQYASRIQAAVLPPVDFLSEWGIDSFILYKPKAIVSGDFYWGVKKEGRIIIAAGDCTGHGVPGAFMSMLGHAFLEEIVNTRDITDAAMILNMLRDEIINTLKQKGLTGEARDGMDISLIILDRQSGKIDFAGANNPLYLISNRKLLKYDADKMPIGIHFITFTPFTNREIKISPDTCLYLFSDGYADQFGGPKGRKFMYKPFQELLLRIHEKPMQEQIKVLDIEFEKWKGDREQVDDVMVIGMRV